MKILKGKMHLGAKELHSKFPKEMAEFELAHDANEGVRYTEKELSDAIYWDAHRHERQLGFK